MQLRLTYSNVAATAALVIAMGGTAIANHDQQTIHGCKSTIDGSVRIVDDPAECEPGPEEEVTWNRQGPQGQQGSQGQPGQQGPMGPAGPQGPPGPETSTSAELLAVGSAPLAAVQSSMLRLERSLRQVKRRSDFQVLVKNLAPQARQRRDDADAKRRAAMERATRITRMMSDMLAAIHDMRQAVIANLGP